VATSNKVDKMIDIDRAGLRSGTGVLNLASDKVPKPTPLIYLRVGQV